MTDVRRLVAALPAASSLLLAGCSLWSGAPPESAASVNAVKHPLAVPTAVIQVYVTKNPQVVLIPLEYEVTRDRSSVCWVSFSASATKLSKSKIKISLNQTSRPSPSPGSSCPARAVSGVYQQVRLPVAYRNQELVDAMTGSLIEVKPTLPPSKKAPTIVP